MSDPMTGDVRSRRKAVHVNCPECGHFCSEAFAYESATEDGMMYTWGGVCKTHGAFTDGS